LQRAQQLLAPILQLRQDRTLLEAAARVHLALQQSAQALAIATDLKRVGYRHPDFVAVFPP
jgi:hypothetical protein